MLFQGQCAMISTCSSSVASINDSPFIHFAECQSLLIVLGWHPAPRSSMFCHTSKISSAFLYTSFTSIVLRTSSVSNTTGQGMPPPVSISHLSIAHMSATFSSRVSPSHGLLVWWKRRLQSTYMGSIKS